MKRTHLPLNGLRVLDAAARHLSFTRAADELAVTPAAVGQQIRALEDMLGVVLFRRTPKGLELTPETEAGLEALRADLADHQASAPEVERAPPSFEESLLDFLATAHLRLGERENCIDGGGAVACLVPVPEDAVHRQFPLSVPATHSPFHAKA